MAITESRKQSDLEKRLKLLRQQVYGKTDRSDYPKIEISENHKSQHTDTLTSDVSYLYQDLFKILALSSSAIGIQLILYLLTRNHILNIKFL